MAWFTFTRPMYDLKNMEWWKQPLRLNWSSHPIAPTPTSMVSCSNAKARSRDGSQNCAFRCLGRLVRQNQTSGHECCWISPKKIPPKLKKVGNFCWDDFWGNDGNDSCSTDLNIRNKGMKSMKYHEPSSFLQLLSFGRRFNSSLCDDILALECRVKSVVWKRSVAWGSSTIIDHQHQPPTDHWGIINGILIPIPTKNASNSYISLVA